MDMNLQKLKSYAPAIISVCIVLLIGALFVYNWRSQHKEVKLQYQPAGACQAFTGDDAKKILGNNVIKQGEDKATLSGDTATSKCAYTDKSLDNMASIAIAIRTGVTDAGVAQNKTDFAANRKASAAEDVPGLGSEEAFYNKTSGMLNLRDGIVWIMINYTRGGELVADSEDKAIEVARVIVGDSKLPQEQPAATNQ